MQGSISVNIQAFCQKFYEYGGLIWLLNPDSQVQRPCRALARTPPAVAASEFPEGAGVTAPVPVAPAKTRMRHPYTGTVAFVRPVARIHGG